MIDNPMYATTWVCSDAHDLASSTGEVWERGRRKMKQASTQHTSNYIACISEPVSSRPPWQTCSRSVMKRKGLLGSQFGRFQSMSGWHCYTGAVLMVGSLWENKLVTWGLHHSDWEAKIRMRWLHSITAFKDILQKLKVSHVIRSFKMSAPSTISPMRAKSYHTCWWGYASLVTGTNTKLIPHSNLSNSHPCHFGRHGVIWVIQITCLHLTCPGKLSKWQALASQIRIVLRS